ncbi:hypothetical protein G647_04837 [Cladophialophora carrionii CBS 160.54]|uniref:FCP1 homology domain-containing protein n=1 Tax=Cladophialophora carrionii CBS 160.54 TaxID=1279043 RepID=V9D8Q6_9EURO|nr:uncharacterized protein G647_04837 [Cladophialophora carrionii CBS 160.54]ETI23041.1 hypothetical protein G647_04837 [Cladophialophora carrionii CBS 160.54]
MGKKKGGAKAAPHARHGQQQVNPQTDATNQLPLNRDAGNFSLPHRSAQVQQGDYYDCYRYCQDRVDIYAAVDAWRSYRDGTNNLQTAADFQPFFQSRPTFFGSGQQHLPGWTPPGHNGSLGAPQGQQIYAPAPLGQQPYPLAPQAMNPYTRPSAPVEHSHFKPYQPLRLVHSYARYPSYRVNKPYRVSNGTVERQVIQQARNNWQSLPRAQTQDPRRRPKARQLPEPTVQTPPETRNDRYPLRNRRPDQTVPFSTGVADDFIEPNRTSGNSALPRVPAAQKTSRYPSQDPADEAPRPTGEYKRNAAPSSATRDRPQKLLVILDLNGTVLVRPNKSRPKNIIVRPGVPTLLDYLFRNHVVMVYTSTRPQNCAAMVEKFFRPDQRAALAAVWARDKLGLTQEQYYNKVQVYKRLEPVWQDEAIQMKADPGKRWDQSNTVLVDDSQIKALAQPHNLLQIPEFLNNEPKTGLQAKLAWRLTEEAIVQSVQQKLEELTWQVDVSRLIREWQTGKRQAPGVVDETVDQKALQNAGDRASSPTPDPSNGDRESSYQPQPQPQQLQTPRESPMPVFEKHLPQYKPVEVEMDDGVSSDDDGGTTLDDLQAQINRSLSLNQSLSIQNQNQRQLTAGAATDAGAVATIEGTKPSRLSELSAHGGDWADTVRETQEDPRVSGQSPGTSTVQAREQAGNTDGAQGKKASEGYGIQGSKGSTTRATGRNDKGEEKASPCQMTSNDNVEGGTVNIDGETAHEPMTPESLGG